MSDLREKEHRSRHHHHRTEGGDERRRQTRERSRSRERRPRDEKDRNGEASRHHRHHDDAPKVTPPVKLTADHFSEYSVPFRLWLKDRRGKLLFDLSKEDAHKYFGDFINRWNDGRLDAKYYKDMKSLETEVDDGHSRTKYHWGFADKLSEREAFDLERLSNQVHSSSGQ